MLVSAAAAHAHTYLLTHAFGCFETLFNWAVSNSCIRAIVNILSKARPKTFVYGVVCHILNYIVQHKTESSKVALLSIKTYRTVFKTKL